MIERNSVSRSSRLGFDYIPPEVKQKSETIFRASKHYNSMAQLFERLYIVFLLGSIFMAGYLFFKSGFWWLLGALVAAVFLIPVVYKLANNVYSVNPLFKYFSVKDKR